MKILIVEDDLEISKLLADFLQGNGYEVLCQYDGLHVLDCIQEHQIDLILLDIMLPYRSGDTILADIRKFSTVPVIVISAKETTQKHRTRLICCGLVRMITLQNLSIWKKFSPELKATYAGFNFKTARRHL